MLQVNQTIEHGKKTYTFISRGTEYTVIDDNDGFFTVFSQRVSLSYNPQCNVYTLTEMAARSKALAHLVLLIK